MAVLNKLQQIFKSSRGCDRWLAAFVAVLGMCMALEDQQKTIHLVMSTKATTEGLDSRDAQGQADIACREIDTRMLFVQQIFRWKYNRKHNPLVNVDHDWEKEAGFGDKSSVEFVRQVAQLVRENSESILMWGLLDWIKANVLHSGLFAPAAAREYFVRESDAVFVTAGGRVLVEFLVAERFVGTLTTHTPHQRLSFRRIRPRYLSTYDISRHAIR